MGRDLKLSNSTKVHSFAAMKEPGYEVFAIEADLRVKRRSFVL
jgi:hypothetical protein